MEVYNIYKPIDELVRALLGCKRPTSRRHRIATVPIIGNFHLGYGYTKCFLSQSSKQNELIFNTMFYDSGCLKGPNG